MIAHIYKSLRKPDAYLYLRDKDAFTLVPDIVRTPLGLLEFVMSLELSEGRTLASPNRKPNPGMGLQAVKDFPDIDLNKAIMVGNTISDMQFGRNLGVQTIFLPTTRPEVDLNDEPIDAVYNSLLDFAIELKNQR